MSVTRRAVVLSFLALAACGGSSSKGASSASTLETILPSDNEVTGWTRSAAIRILPAAKAGEGYASGGVNGDAAKFIANGLQTLGIAKYKTTGAETIELRVWDLGAASAASACWTDLITNDPRYTGANWSAVTVGEAGRIQATGTYWWVVARKGAFVAEVFFTPDDAAQRQPAIDFLKAVVAAIP